MPALRPRRLPRGRTRGPRPIPSVGAACAPAREKSRDLGSSPLPRPISGKAGRRISEAVPPTVAPPIRPLAQRQGDPRHDQPAHSRPEPLRQRRARPRAPARAGRPRAGRRRRRRAVPRIPRDRELQPSTTAGSRARPSTPAGASACARSPARRSGSRTAPSSAWRRSSARSRRSARSRPAISGQLALPPAGHQPQALRRGQPDPGPAAGRQGRPARADRRLRPRQGPEGQAGQRQPRRLLAAGPDPARRRLAQRRHPAAGPAQRPGRGRRRPAHGDRQLRRRRPVRLRRAARRPAKWRAMVDEALRQALVNLEFGRGAGRRDDRGARPRLARRPAARGDRPRPRGRLQPQADLGLRGPARPAGRRARASPWSTTARSTSGAAR